MKAINLRQLITHRGIMKTSIKYSLHLQGSFFGKTNMCHECTEKLFQSNQFFIERKGKEMCGTDSIAYC